MGTLFLILAFLATHLAAFILGGIFALWLSEYEDIHTIKERQNRRPLTEQELQRIAIWNTHLRTIMKDVSK